MGRISLNLEFPLFYYQIRSVYGILYQKYLLISKNLSNEVNVQEEELSFIVGYNLFAFYIDSVYPQVNFNR